MRMDSFFFRVAAVWLLLFSACPCATAAATPTITLSAAAGDVDLVGKVRYLKDESGALSFADVQARAAEFAAYPASADLNFGYRGRVYWVALPVTLAADAPRDWWLEIGYPPLEYVRFYAPDGTVMEGGARVPFSQRVVAHRNHVFPVTFPPDAQTATLYVRVQSDTTGLIPVRLRSAGAFHHNNVSSYMVMGVYYGLLFALGAYNLMLFVALRSAVFGYYVLWVIALAGGVAALNGVGSQFLWRDWTEASIAALAASLLASNALGVQFSRVFLETRTHFPRFDRLLVAVGVIGIVGALLTFVLPLRIGIQFMSVTALATTSVLIALAVAAVRRSVPSAGYYLIAWIVLLVGAGLSALRNFGLVPNMFISQYGLQIGSAFEMLLLSFALAARYNALKRANDEAQANLLAAARRQEAELEERVTARTLELAQTNTRLAESEARLRDLAHHDPLTGLPNRLRFAEQLNASLMRAAASGSDAAVLLLDLDGFKPVNDTFGHAAGDAVLQAVAARLRDVLRAEDFAARLGGDEFVVVLDAPQTQDHVWRVAEKLIAAIDVPVQHGKDAVKVGVSIGIAMGHADTSVLLRQADAALYRAKLQGRGRAEVFSAVVAAPNDIV
jgi:diguanylate cyclase (GGDEF)-like protein